MKRRSVFLCAVMLCVAAVSCSRNDNKLMTTYSVRMTDAPAPYSAVFIDLQGVEIIGTNGLPVPLNVHRGIYNLLDFSNGLDTIIATGIVEVATIQQVRLILGPDNTVVADGVIHHLSTPSAEQSGLKLQVNQALKAGVNYSMLLDFDANQSIVLEGNGNYKLKPVIRTVEPASSGSISGSISKVGILAFVTASSGISYSSSVNANGNFTIGGIPPGTYSVTLTPAFPFEAVTRTNVTVVAGATTGIGTIIL
jgi:hypothetical protein